MRDSTLDQGNAYLAALRSACDAARRDAMGFPHAESVVSALAAWCRAVLFKPDWMETRSERGGLSDLLTLPPAQSPLQALQCVADASRRESLRKAFSDLMEGGESSRGNLPAWLLGTALARSLVAELSAVTERAGPLFTEARKLTGSRDVAYCAFEESLREGLHGSPTARSAIRFVLESWINEINANPGIGTFAIERSSFRALVCNWRRNPSIASLWKHREAPFPVHYDTLEVLPGILPTDRAAILERLDGFRFPEPIRQVLRHPEVLHDRDEIAAALTDAPTCSDDGRFWNGSLVALLVLETAEDHCRALWEVVHRHAEPGNPDTNAAGHLRHTLSTWFEEQGRIVMERRDGRFLGSQWLFMKLGDERLERAHHHHAGGEPDRLLREGVLIEWIARGLFEAGLTNEDVAALVDLPDIAASEVPAPARPSSRHDNPAQPRLAALSVMSLSGQLMGCTTVDEEQELLDRLDALLASRDPEFESEFDLDAGGHGLPASCFGRMLASQERPAERWRQSWDLLVEQRRRAQHWRHTRDGDALAPTVFLLALGLAGIDCLLDPGNGRRDEAGRLWGEVFDGARECWLTMSVQHLRERVETFVGRLLARHPMVFREPPGEGNVPERDVNAGRDDYRGLLARDLGYLGGNDLMLAVCCLNAGHNGVSPADMGDVLARDSGHLDAILRQFERWQALERDVRKRPEILEALANFRHETSGEPNGANVVGE